VLNTSGWQTLKKNIICGACYLFYGVFNDAGSGKTFIALNIRLINELLIGKDAEGSCPGPL